MIGEVKDIEKKKTLEFLDPWGHPIEVQVIVNGNLLYGRTLVLEGRQGDSYRYRTDDGKKISRGRNASIKSLAKSLL